MPKFRGWGWPRLKGPSTERAEPSEPIEHQGWRVVYSADTGESDALVRLAAGADVLLCEASFLDGQDDRPDLHLTARQAAAHDEAV